MEKSQTEVHLSREMGLLDVTMIGVGAMIGAGIFVLTGIAAGVAGPALILAFFLNGLVALLTAMSYAELGSCYHDAGGGYLWVKEGLPKWNGFLSGWMSWFAHAVACSLYALGFGAYFEHVLTQFDIFVPHWGFFSPQKVLAAFIAIVFGYINFRGASETGKIGNMITMGKIAILAVFVALGMQIVFSHSDWTTSFTPFFANGFGGVVKAMGLTFIAFQGFEVISQCSEEVKNPKRNIPRAIFLSLAIVVPIYLLTAFVSLGAVRPEGMTSWDYLALNKETALVEISKTFFRGGGIMLLFGGLISTMSALNATVYSSSRVAFAMGRDRNFPTFFSKIHPKKFTPAYAIGISLFIVVIMSVSLHIEDVAAAADVMFLLLFLQVNLTLIRLRKKRPDLDRGFVTPFFPYLTILAIVLLLFLAVYMFTYSPVAWLVTAAWIAVGLGIYKLYASKREVQHTQHVRALKRLQTKDYRILLPVSNPATVASLVIPAIAIARKNNAEVILLHVIEVEQHTPLMAGTQNNKEVEEILDMAQGFLNDAGIPSRPFIRVSHRISQAIVETAIDEECNFIILGRQKNPSFLERLYSSVIDSVVQNSPCEVAVLHGDLAGKSVKNIFVPYAENIHTHLALQVTPAFNEFFQSKAHVRVVFESEISKEELQKQKATIEGHLQTSSLNASIEIISNQEIVRGFVQGSRTADLVIMGARSGYFFEILFGQSTAEEITERVNCPVLWVVEYEERPSFLATLVKPLNEEIGERK